jgi:hypothetical protein
MYHEGHSTQQHPSAQAALHLLFASMSNLQQRFDHAFELHMALSRRAA